MRQSMRKFALASVAVLGAISLSGCVIVVADDDDFDHDFKASFKDGYRVLDRDGDYSTIGGDLDLRGRVGGDVSLLSGDVNADDLQVGGDVSIAAGDVDFSGAVDGEASVAAGDVVWSADTSGELSIAAGDLDVDARVGGETSLAAGSMNIRGEFRDSFTAEAARITFDAEVFGDTTLVAGDDFRPRRRDADYGRVELDGHFHEDLTVCAIDVDLSDSLRVEGRLEIWAEEAPDQNGSMSDIVFHDRDGRDCDDLLDNA